jgi:hypothetical protein
VRKLRVNAMTLTVRGTILLASLVFIPGLSERARAEEDASFGAWSIGESAPGRLLATHATLLRNNKILVVGGSSYNCCYTWGAEEARLYDIATGSWGPALASPAPYGATGSVDPGSAHKDAFCSGHTHDASGGVIFQGGLHSYVHNGHGIVDSARYDPVTGGWTPLSGAAAHWYPTLVAGVGHTFIFPGVNTELAKTSAGDKIQALAYGAASWVTTGVSLNTLGTYPRVTLLPDGRLFVASPSGVDRKNYTFDPVSNLTALAGDDVVPESEPGQIHGSSDSWRGTAVLLPLVPSQNDYPRMRFALINGVQAYVKDLADANPAWQPIGNRPAELGSPPPTRAFANSTLLPTGQILVTGGVAPPDNDVNAVKKAELYDPEENRWLLTAPATVARNYHGVALLLPDGRVWTASASKDHSGSQCGLAGCDAAGPEKTEERVEIFTPWYYTADRPVITSCPAEIVADGRPFSIGIARSRSGPVQRVVLMRPGSATHSFDADQRLIQLDIAAATGTSVTLSSPYRAAAAPPGDYMLFALRRDARSGFKQWVPSVACWTRVGVARMPGASIWRYTGPPCTGESCPGWQRLDNNSKTVALAATDTGLYQIHVDGRIWRYTGAPCSGESCPGWQQLDNNARSGMIVAGDPSMVGSGDHFYQLHVDPLYQLHDDGRIWRYTGTECSEQFCPGWERLDNNPKTAEIVAAGGQLFQRHNDGRIWRYLGTPCNGESCPSWRLLDNNPKTRSIVAGGNQLYQLHNGGDIWRHTGIGCTGNSCPGWQQLDNNPRSVAIAATPAGLYQLHNDGWIWRYTGTPCSGNSCPGWQRLDNNPRTKRIAAAGKELYQLHSDARIWRYTGTPCAGDSCPGWQALDNNPNTVEIAAGANQLYQLHKDGAIWRYTGIPCSGNSCPGWERLDNNPNAREIAATGNHLYQRHGDGRIWRYTGGPCSGNSCPGWRQLDNNPKTKRIGVGGFN